MAAVINHMNARSWETLVISMLKVYLLSTVGTITYQERNLACSNKIMLLLTVQWMKYCSMKIKLRNEKEAHENFGSDFDENRLYHIDNMSLDDTKGKLK